MNISHIFCRWKNELNGVQCVKTAESHQPGSFFQARSFTASWKSRLSSGMVFDWVLQDPVCQGLDLWLKLFGISRVITTNWSVKQSWHLPVKQLIVIPVQNKVTDQGFRSVFLFSEHQTILCSTQSGLCSQPRYSLMKSYYAVWSQHDFSHYYSFWTSGLVWPLLSSRYKGSSSHIQSVPSFPHIKWYCEAPGW